MLLSLLLLIETWLNRKLFPLFLNQRRVLNALLYAISSF